TVLQRITVGEVQIVSRAAPVGGDQRKAGGHGLKAAQPEAFTARRHDEDIHLLQQLKETNLVHVPRHHLDSWIVKLVSLWRGHALHQQANRLVRFEFILKGTNQHVDSLTRRQLAKCSEREDIKLLS